MSVDLERLPQEVPDDGYLQYRPLSKAAVASVVVGLLSILALFAWIWAAIPAVGLLLSLYAWRSIKNQPTELSGLGLAKIGFTLSALFLFAGSAWLTYERATEVPEGYERISYEDLQPDPSVPAEQIPPSAWALEGKKVFIKGFIYPGGLEKEGIKTFLLVRDKGDCCFGGDPKITDRIQVTLTDPLRLTFRSRLHKLAGVFHVKPAAAINATGGVYYHLEADHLQ